MKVSRIRLADFLGGSKRARRKTRVDHSLDSNFENPIIHRQIQGEKIYVPLNLGRVWNQVNWNKVE
ncbi:hypothetical protein [Bacillus sp. sid0103]|uniref:hypothetical protein n=1 Tax=Bacillus sp. sid0103 TaxID=2856337 RepID=UPI001C47C65A|nr:hypothetical protein [Bacillus sp. sid0103]